MAATFEVFRDRAEDFRWRLRHDNGQIIAGPGQGYSSRANVLNGIDSVKENAPDAEIVDQTLEEGEATEAAPVSGAVFQLYKDSAEEFRWRLQHENGQIIAEPGQGYTSKVNALNGIQSVKENAPDAEIEDSTRRPASAPESSDATPVEAAPAAAAAAAAAPAPAAAAPAAAAPAVSSFSPVTQAPSKLGIEFYLAGLTKIVAAIFVLPVGIEVTAILSDTKGEELLVIISTIALFSLLIVQILFWAKEFMVKTGRM